MIFVGQICLSSHNYSILGHLGSLEWPKNNVSYYKLEVCGYNQIPKRVTLRPQTDINASRSRLGRQVPRQCCHWWNIAVQTSSSKFSFPKHFLPCCGGVAPMRCIKYMLCWEAWDSQWPLEAESDLRRLLGPQSLLFPRHRDILWGVHTHACQS